MSLRFLHQSMTELDGLTGYRDALAAHARRVLGDRAQVDLRGVRPGSYASIPPSAVLGFPYPYHLVLGQVVEAARAAERDGYDAFIVGSFSEPFLRETRCAVDIPVASLAESTLLVGCSLGGRQALVTNGPAVAALVRTAVDKHHLGGRVSGVYALDPPMTEPELAAADPELLVEAFRRIAARAVAEGADVVVPAEGVLAEVLQGRGVDRVDGAVVLDSMGVVWHHAEMLVRLRRSTGALVGRRWEYPRAPDAVVDALLDASRRPPVPGGAP